MNNTQILSSLQVMRPELESYYTQWSSKLVSSALNELGENLKGIYNSWTFSSVKEVIFHNCDTFLRDDFRFIDQINAKGYKFSQEKAAKNAKAFLPIPCHLLRRWKENLCSRLQEELRLIITTGAQHPTLHFNNLKKSEERENKRLTLSDL
jgi:hypothetical protein